MKRVIITGATGFVGANLARKLYQDGHEIHLFIRPQHQTWRLQEIKNELRLHHVDLSSEETLIPLIAQIEPDWIFHLAVHGAYSNQTDLQPILQTNIIGTINLLQAAIKVGFESFVNTGSSSEYGYKNHPPSETEWLEPNSYYAVTKAAATLFCRYTAQSKNLHIPTLRLYSVYGPYEEPTRLIPTLINQGLQGKLPPLVNPDTARDYIYVDDVVAAYLQACTIPNQELGAVYNVGTGQQTSLREVVDVACQVLNIRDEPQWGTMEQRIWDTNIWVADNHKIKTELGWQPSYTFADGFAATVTWFKKYLAIQ